MAQSKEELVFFPHDPAISRPQIPVLTSLRFFAAFFILLYHAGGQLGFAKRAFSDIGLPSFMAFFFVLSGFILVYCYPSLNGREETKRFLIARIARVWPLHALTLFLAIVIVPAGTIWALQPEIWKRVVSFFLNISLLQAWVPFPWSYSSYNEVSWSISAELFFYLLFPFLLPQMRRRPALVMGSLVSLVAVAIVLCYWLEVPRYFDAKTSFNASSLFHMNPLMRLLEFSFGMLAGLLAERLRGLRVSRWGWTALELLALSLFTVNILSLRPIADSTNFGSGLVTWIMHGGALPSAFLVVLLFSLSRGFVTAFLEKPFWVLLGNCSYSIYLFHNMFLLQFDDGPINPFASLPTWLQFPAFLSFILLLSYFSWRFFETPMRKKLTRILEDRLLTRK